MIRLGQLYEFSVTILQMIVDEKTEKIRWEYYLHKVWDDMSFEEYVNACESKKAAEKPVSASDVADIVNSSAEILKGFVPPG